MKTIITGVDSSQTALAAAEKAAELAASFDAELYVFSAYSISSAVAMQTAKSGNMSNKTSEAYQRLADGQAALHSRPPSLWPLSCAIPGQSCRLRHSLLRASPRKYWFSRLKSSTPTPSSWAISGHKDCSASWAVSPAMLLLQPIATCTLLTPPSRK